ncbi:MAG: FkbM family methyltransferase [Minwuia sp.]|nr:FkbM family methyltransferase [Minwuia sp.]
MNGLKRVMLNVMLGLDRRIRSAGQTRPIMVWGTLPDGTAFGHTFADPYWAKGGLQEGAYEPEILSFLQAVRDIEFDFIDCGANYGYWSALVSGPALGSHRAIAIEGSPITFRSLSKVRDRNESRFDVTNNAIAALDGAEVEFHHSFHHAGSQILAAEGGIRKTGSDEVALVKTISINTLIEKYSAPDRPLVIKLDVEGFEIEAIKGAKRALQHDCILAYEDHGMDPESEVTAFLLDQGWLVYWPVVGANGELARFDPVRDAASLKGMKTNPHRGYNLYAMPPREESVWDQVIGIGRA